MVAPTMALRGYLIGRSPLRMRTTQFAKASGRLPFTHALRLPRDLSRPFTMRTRNGEQEIPVALPPNVPQPPDLDACFERYSLSMRLQDGCSLEEYQEIAANVEKYAPSIIAGCEKKPYARLRERRRSASSRERYPGGIEMKVYDNGSDMAKGLKSLDTRIEHCTLSGEVTEGGLWYDDEADEH
ncbi:hypothetical protein D0866_14290 [Hortaea werneckii]|uniref:Uncharacterized protein n=1 Tax=Hortaea werneckii TaxID=91943 RepID=A0A3M6Z9I7_HORWE|nr:hypothetical protein D0866_14290 [Hortaea werneckii]